MIRPLLLLLLVAPAFAADPPKVTRVEVPPLPSPAEYTVAAGRQIPLTVDAKNVFWSAGTESICDVTQRGNECIFSAPVPGRYLLLAASEKGLSRVVVTVEGGMPLPLPPNPVPPVPVPPPVDLIKQRLVAAFALDAGTDAAKKADAKALSAICAGAALLAVDPAVPTAAVLLDALKARAASKVTGLLLTKAAIVKELAATLKDPKAALTDDSRKAVAALFTAAAGALEELSKP